MAGNHREYEAKHIWIGKCWRTNTLQCPFCNAHFVSRLAINYHIEQIEKKFICFYCNSIYPKRNIAHMDECVPKLYPVQNLTLFTESSKE